MQKKEVMHRCRARITVCLVVVAYASVALPLLSFAQDSTSIPIALELRRDTSPSGLAVTNLSGKYLIAWSMRVVDPVDPRIVRLVEPDYYEAMIMPGASSFRPLAPNETRVLPLLKNDAADARVDPVAAVFTDNTAIGSEERLQVMFKRRLNRARNWQRVSALIPRALRTQGATKDQAQSLLNVVDADAAALGRTEAHDMLANNLAVVVASPDAEVRNRSVSALKLIDAYATQSEQYTKQRHNR